MVSPHKALWGSCNTPGRCSGNRPWETPLCPVVISQPGSREVGVSACGGQNATEAAALAVGESALFYVRADRGHKVLSGPSAFGFQSGGATALVPAASLRPFRLESQRIA